MDERQITVVQSTWAQVEPISGAAAALFYDRLFELAPDTRPLFSGDMTQQGRKLMQMIGTVVASLDRLDRVVPAIQALGRRHGGYGVRPEHYDVVGAALLWTLGEGLGPAFTPEAHDAWAAAYGVLATTMQSAAAAAAA